MKKILVLVAALCVLSFFERLTFAFSTRVPSLGLQVAESFLVSGGSVSYRDWQ